MIGLEIVEKNRFKLAIDILFLSLSLYGVSNWSPKGEDISPFKGLMINVTATLQETLTAAGKNITQGFDNYLLNVKASKENLSLKYKISELEKELFEKEEIEKENFRLRNLLDYGKDISPTKIVAKVISWNTSSEFRVLRINKGAKHGITLQAPVVTPNGLVGYIYRITDSFSDILTIEDSNNHVDGLLERTRGYGILEGNPEGKIVLKYIQKSLPIIIHDQVITSGLGNIYPKGIMIGTVSKIEKDSYGVTQYIEVKPSVSFDKLEEVIVLQLPQDRNKELEELSKPQQGENAI